MGFFSSIAKAVAGPLIGGAFSAFGQERANDAAQAATQAQMDFQERMSSTSYQRGMKDMRLAGLNPMLAYSQGGASSPGGSTYSPQNVGAAGAAGAAMGANTALSTQRLRLEKNKMIAETDKLYQSGSKDSAEADLATHQRINAQVQNKLMKQQLKINEPDVSSARHAERLYESAGGDFFKWWQMLNRR